MVICYLRKVRIFVVININSKAFFDLLFYVLLTIAYDFPEPGVPKPCLP